MAYKMDVMGIEGLLVALVVLTLPFVILGVLVRVLPTQRLGESPHQSPAIAGGSEGMRG
jgi:hypothetical protein